MLYTETKTIFYLFIFNFNSVLKVFFGSFIYLFFGHAAQLEGS